MASFVRPHLYAAPQDAGFRVWCWTGTMQNPPVQSGYFIQDTGYELLRIPLLETVLQTTLERLVDGREITIRGARYWGSRRSLCHVLDARTPPTSPIKSGTYSNRC